MASAWHNIDDSQFVLASISGEQYVEEYGLNVETNYDPTINVAVSQEMTSGAFRVLHNLIPAQFKYVCNFFIITTWRK